MVVHLPLGVVVVQRRRRENVRVEAELPKNRVEEASPLAAVAVDVVEGDGHVCADVDGLDHASRGGLGDSVIGGGGRSSGRSHGCG